MIFLVEIVELVDIVTQIILAFIVIIVAFENCYSSFAIILKKFYYVKLVNQEIHTIKFQILEENFVDFVDIDIVVVEYVEFGEIVFPKR